MKLFAAAIIVSAALTSQDVFAGPPATVVPDNDPGAAASTVHLLRQNNITSTGATVPHPGAFQTSEPAPVYSHMDRLNDKIDRSICRGC